MNHQMLIVFAILATAVGLFVWGRPRADVIGLMVASALMTTGVLTPTEALAGFGSPVVILLAAIFIVSAGLVNTGVTQRLAQFIVKVGGTSETRLVAMIMLVSGVVGSVLNSAAIVIIFIPVVLTIANKTGLNKKRLLMPLCVAVMISGMMTLIASSPNIIIEDVLRDRGIKPPLGFFSFTPFGIVTLGIGIGFMLVMGRSLLSRQQSGDTGIGSPHAVDLIISYGLQMRWHHVYLEGGSPLLGQSAVAVRTTLEQRYGAELLGLEKHFDGATRFLPPQPEAVIGQGDVLFVLVDEDRVRELGTDLRCRVIGPPLPDEQRGALLQHLGVAEVMAAPDSMSIGKTLRRLDLPDQYDVAVLGVRHRGEAYIDDLAARKLDFGDTLLVGGNWDDITRLSDDRRNFVLLNMPAEYEERLSAPGRANIAVTILVAMVGVMAFQWLPISAAALIAALAMLATGCVSVDSIYTSVSWTTLVLIAGMLPLATALTKTGATNLMSTNLVKALGLVSPTMMLAAVFVITALLCLFISNAATAVIFAPVAIDAAQALHVSPQAFAMTVAIACSAAFVTPVSSPTNMLVMEPGDYSAADYAKVGVPMLILTMLVTVGLARIIYLSG